MVISGRHICGTTLRREPSSLVQRRPSSRHRWIAKGPEKRDMESGAFGRFRPRGSNPFRPDLKPLKSFIAVPEDPRPCGFARASEMGEPDSRPVPFDSTQRQCARRFAIHAFSRRPLSRAIHQFTGRILKGLRVELVRSPSRRRRSANCAFLPSRRRTSRSAIAQRRLLNEGQEPDRGFAHPADLSPGSGKP
jgi:hypothetical protein